MAGYTADLGSVGTFTQGDRFVGMSIGPVLVNGLQPAGTLARVRCQFRRGSEVITFDSDAGESPDGLISIDDAATWEASIPETADFMAATQGTWSFDIQYYETGRVGYVTYHRGTALADGDITKP